MDLLTRRTRLKKQNARLTMWAMLTAFDAALQAACLLLRKARWAMRPVTEEPAMKPQDKEHGEGNYKATRDYNERTKAFVGSGKVDEAAGKAKPKNEQEARELEKAEEAGKSHAKDGGDKPTSKSTR
jgi:hypothetical protein